MTTHRRYHFECPYSQESNLAHDLLEAMCRQHHWYEEPLTVPDGEGFRFSFTVHARDQWWCHHRAIALATAVYEALQLSPAKIPVPLWEGFAPHTNRGFY